MTVFPYARHENLARARFGARQWREATERTMKIVDRLLPKSWTASNPHGAEDSLIVRGKRARMIRDVRPRLLDKIQRRDVDLTLGQMIERLEADERTPA